MNDMKFISELSKKKLAFIGSRVQAGALTGLAAGAGMFFFTGFDGLLLFRFFLGGGLIGFSVSVADRYFLLEELADKIFFYALLLRSLIFAVLIYMCVHFASAIAESILNDTLLADIYLTNMQNGFAGFWAIFFAALLGASGLMLARLTGFEWLTGYFIGRYRFPTKEERIFLQINLDAESVGKPDNSELCLLLQDFYFDINEPIVLSEGEIYQCRDSELIVTWVLSGPKANYRAIECYVMMREKLADRAAHYERKFGFAPNIKCGIHAGEVYTAWVGDTKKSLIFRGDTPHITSRIQAVCNLHHASLLVSSDYYDAVKMPREFNIIKLPALSFKGKSLPVSVLKIESL